MGNSTEFARCECRAAEPRKWTAQQSRAEDCDGRRPHCERRPAAVQVRGLEAEGGARRTQGGARLRL